MSFHPHVLAAAFAIVLSACGGAVETATPSDARQPASATLLLGTWTSTDDPDSVVEFSDETYTDVYAGERLDSFPYTLSDGCDGSEALVFAFTVMTDEEPICYAVSELTETRLEYMMAGGRGNTLSYRRTASRAAPRSDGAP